MGASLVRVEVKWKGDALAARLPSVRARVLGEMGAYILDRSRARAPKRSGALRASARAEVSGNAVQVGYGVPYALMQHESARYRHPNGGGARFLSSVIEETGTVQRAERLCAAALRDLLS